MAASSADHYVVRLLGAAAVAEIFDNSSAESSPLPFDDGMGSSPHQGSAYSGSGVVATAERIRVMGLTHESVPVDTAPLQSTVRARPLLGLPPSF